MSRTMVVATVLTVVATGVGAVPADAGTPTCHGRSATIVGTPASEVIRGTSHADVIVGASGNDTIHGGGGGDWICGNGGHDRIMGGSGNDLLFGGLDWLHVNDEGSTERVGDVVAGGPGDDRLSPGHDTRAADEIIHDSISWEAAARGMRIDAAAGRASGQGRDSFSPRDTWIVGSGFADQIEGSERADLLSGGGGADVIRGFAGNDRIVTDPGGPAGAADVARGGDGDDVITAGGGEDSLYGGNGDDIIEDMGPADDRMYGGHGADMLFTQLTDVPGVEQIVDGGPGANDFVDLHTQTINPATTPSTATWDMATGRLVFTLDHPVPATVVGVEHVGLSAWGTTWRIEGTAGPETIGATGSWGTVFEGLDGDDAFFGSAYDDTFDGGRGDDHSLGMGVGTDTCIGVEMIEGNDCEIVMP